MVSTSLPIRQILLLATAAVLAAGAGAFRSRAQHSAAAEPPSDYDIPAFPADVVRPFSFGLRSVTADVMFLEAIQVVGGRPKRGETAAEGASTDRALHRLLTYATELDPKFAGAYRFAGYAMPRHTSDGKATNVREAAALLEQGVRERGDDWRLPFTLGFIESYYLSEFDKAGRDMALAAKAPGAPAFVGLLATRLMSQSGELDLALPMARAMAEQVTEDKAREEWNERVLDLEMERDLRAIEAAAARFRERTGAVPQSLDALVRAGDLRRLPREPHGGRYVLDADGKPRSTAKARLTVTGRAGTLSGLEVR